MIVALIDNGSLEPAAHLNLRARAAALAEKAAVPVAAVSWKHSDRVAAAALGGAPAWTLASWVRAQVSHGENEFVFVPFFISPQGAIGSALRSDLEKLQLTFPGSHSCRFTFTEGLGDRGAIAGLVAERVRETILGAGLRQPAVVVVDHGGPSATSAAVRDSLAQDIRSLLGSEIGSLAAASMEGAHPPLLADQFEIRGFERGDVVVVPLFLSPGRHAGADGDIVRICRSAEARFPGLRCHLTGLVGTHPNAVAPLALALRKTLATFPLPSLA
jgi:sirohydrochlorin ferrochelatase